MQQFGSLLIIQLTRLLLGQNLVPGQQLTSEGGLFSLTLTTTHGLFAYFNSYPPQPYYSCTLGNDYIISYAQFQTKFFVFFEGNNSLSAIFTSLDRSHYMRFGLDGHSRVYDIYWQQVNDLLTSDMVPVVTLRFVANILFVLQRTSVVVRNPEMGQAIFSTSKKGSPTSDALWLLNCLVKLPNITFF